jgi:hypothetical protein
MPSARAIDLWENVSRIARSQFRLESQLLDRNTVLARKVTVVKSAFTTDPLIRVFWLVLVRPRGLPLRRDRLRVTRERRQAQNWKLETGN